MDRDLLNVAMRRSRLPVANDPPNLSFAGDARGVLAVRTDCRSPQGLVRLADGLPVEVKLQPIDKIRNPRDVLPVIAQRDMSTAIIYPEE
jgi:hypothetical protein